MLKRGGAKNSLYNYCTISKADLARRTLERICNNRNSAKLLSDCGRDVPDATEKLMQILMLFTQQVEISWPIAMVQTTLHMYRIFWGEPMHDLFYGNFDFSKNFGEHVRRWMPNNVTVENKKEQSRMLQVILRNLFDCFQLDYKRRWASVFSMRYRVHVYFSKRDGSDKMNGVFNEANNGEIL